MNLLERTKRATRSVFSGRDGRSCLWMWWRTIPHGRASGHVLGLHEKPCCTEEEYEVICCRFGLFGKREQTQREIARHLHISRSYVSRIEKNALHKLRTLFLYKYVWENRHLRFTAAEDIVNLQHRRPGQQTASAADGERFSGICPPSSFRIASTVTSQIVCHPAS